MASMMAAGSPAASGGGGNFTVPNVPWPGTDVGTVIGPSEAPATAINGTSNTSGTPGSGVGKYALQAPKNILPKVTPSAGPEVTVSKAELDQMRNPQQITGSILSQDEVDQMRNPQQINPTEAEMRTFENNIDAGRVKNWSAYLEKLYGKK